MRHTPTSGCWERVWWVVKMKLLSAKTFLLLVTIILSLKGETMIWKRSRFRQQQLAVSTNIDKVIKETFDHKFHVEVIKKVDLMKFFCVLLYSGFNYILFFLLPLPSTFPHLVQKCVETNDSEYCTTKVNHNFECSKNRMKTKRFYTIWQCRWFLL